MRDKESNKLVGDCADACFFYINIYTYTYIVCICEFVHRYTDRQSRDTAESVSWQNKYRYSLRSTIYMLLSSQASAMAKATFEMLT